MHICYQPFTRCPVLTEDLLLSSYAGWAVRSRDDGAEAEMYVNEELDIETEIRPQTIICRNLYQ
eukprot:1408019-Rhodomonas_salina.1